MTVTENLVCFSDNNVGLPDDATKCAGQKLPSNPGEKVAGNKGIISSGSCKERMKLASLWNWAEVAQEFINKNVAF